MLLAGVNQYMDDVSQLIDNERVIEQCTDNNYSRRLQRLLGCKMEPMRRHLEARMREAGYPVSDSAPTRVACPRGVDPPLRRAAIATVRTGCVVNINQQALDVLNAYTTDFIPFIIRFLA